MTELAEWDSFYLIVGTAAGALIGLQFVVMTLLATMPLRNRADAGAAFGTPTVVHFGTVLFLSALMRAPWQSVSSAAVMWGVLGSIAIVYAVIVCRRMINQTSYEPEFEDWLFHACLPLIAYGTLILTALFAGSYGRVALFGVGFSVLLLLFVGIHNSWDAVTWHIFVVQPKMEAELAAEEPGDTTAAAEEQTS